MSEPINSIPIDFGSRYILEIRLPEHGRDQMTAAKIDSISDGLEKWWRSGRKFLILPIFGDEIAIRLERVEDETE